MNSTPPAINAAAPIVAHRGTPTIQPENTLPSFELALAQGADVLERDLHFRRCDDQLVLFHDDTLDRMTDGQGPLNQYTYSELKQRNTRAPGGQLTSARIPTLAQSIPGNQSADAIVTRAQRSALFANPLDAQRLIDLLDHYDMVQRTAIISFHQDTVAGVEAARPTIPTGHITMWNPLPTGKAELLGPVLAVALRQSLVCGAGAPP